MWCKINKSYSSLIVIYAVIWVKQFLDVSFYFLANISPTQSYLLRRVCCLKKYLVPKTSKSHFHRENQSALGPGLRYHFNVSLLRLFITDSHSIITLWVSIIITPIKNLFFMGRNVWKFYWKLGKPKYVLSLQGVI